MKQERARAPQPCCCGQFHEGDGIHEALIRNAPHEDGAWGKARLLRDMGDLRTARDGIVELLKGEPDSPRFLNALAVLEAEQGRPAQGIEILKQLLVPLRRNPEWYSRAATNLATMMFESGDAKGGISISDEVLESGNQGQRAHYVRGIWGSGPDAESPFKVFRTNSFLQVHPYLNFDLAWREFSRTIWVISLDEELSSVRVKVPPAGEHDSEFRLTLGRKVVAGIGLADGFYGTIFSIASCDGKEIEMVAAIRVVGLSRVQRRQYVRAQNFQAISEIALACDGAWDRLSPNAYKLVNVSATGLCLALRKDLEPGQLIRVRFDLEDGRLDALAAVARIAPNHTYGLRFTNLDDNDVERLHKAVFRAHLRQSRHLFTP